VGEGGGVDGGWGEGAGDEEDGWGGGHVGWVGLGMGWLLGGMRMKALFLRDVLLLLGSFAGLYTRPRRVCIFAQSALLCDALFSSDDGPSKCVLNNVRSKVRCGVILYECLRLARYIAPDTPR
jgi:hypothetical protein